MAKPIGLNWNVELSFYRKKFRPPPPRGGGAAPPEFFFLLFFTFQTIFSRFRPKKKFQTFFSPRTGSTALPPWGKKFLKNFLWSKSTQNGLKREKKQRKIFRGGANFFFFFKGITKNHTMQKLINVGRAISSQPPTPLWERCFEYSPIDRQCIRLE